MVDVPRIQNYYAISPLFDLSALPGLSTSWSIRFPTLPALAAFLARLSSALKPFSMQLSGKGQRQLCLEALIWLLRHQVVVQMHVRLRLVAGEEAKRRAAKIRGEERIRMAEQRQKRLAKIAERERKRQAMDAMTSSSSQLSALSKSAPADVIGAGEGYERGRSRDRSMSPGRGEEGEEAESSSQGIPTFASALSATRPDQSHLKPSPRTPGVAALPPPISIPVPTPLPGQIEELRFERRPVLRSRSPSRMLALASERGASSLSTRGSGSRPSTPRNRGRAMTHSREPSGSGGMTIDASQERQARQPQSVPAAVAKTPTAQQTSRASRRDAKKENASRSPSRARMRVTGFGEGEEIFVESGEGDTDGIDSTVEWRAEEARRLSLVGEEGEGEASQGKSKEDAKGKGDHGDDNKDGESNASVDVEEAEEEEEEENDIEVESWETHPQASIIAEPSRAGGEENEWIAVMVEERPPWLAQRLFKWVACGG